jgi:hypothetical protein
MECECNLCLNLILIRSIISGRVVIYADVDKRHIEDCSYMVLCCIAAEATCASENSIDFIATRTE